MKTTARRSTQRRIALKNSAGGRFRRGTMMIWSIWLFLTMLMVAAFAFNVIWLSCVRSEARRHAESAAIVGGHAFLSDDLLRLRQQPFENDGRAVRCRAAAVDYVRQAANPAVIPMITQDDVELTPPSVASQPVNSGISSNATVPEEIRVSYGKLQPGDQLRLFFSGLTGVRNARLGVTAAASIEHAPVGFQPGRNLTIPVLPFAIVDQSQIDGKDINGNGLWSEQIESGKGSDNLSWSPQQHAVDNGPDGLPEVTVTLTPNSAGAGPEGLVPLMFAAASEKDSTSQTVNWIEHGVPVEDLQSLGLSTLSFPSTMPVVGLTNQTCAEVATYLQAHIGQAFIVCLCNPAASATTSGTRSGSTALSTVKLNRPVAARVMAVGISAGSVRIRLQPCVLITSTAIMSASPPASLNRYIYSVRLCD